MGLYSDCRVCKNSGEPSGSGEYSTSQLLGCIESAILYGVLL